MERLLQSYCNSSDEEDENEPSLEDDSDESSFSEGNKVNMNGNDGAMNVDRNNYHMDIQFIANSVIDDVPDLPQQQTSVPVSVQSNHIKDDDNVGEEDDISSRNSDDDSDDDSNNDNDEDNIDDSSDDDRKKQYNHIVNGGENKEKALNVKGGDKDNKLFDFTIEELSGYNAAPPRTKNELKSTQLNRNEIGVCIGTNIAADDLDKVGKIMYFIDDESIIVVQSGYTISPLAEGSILCTQEGISLGKIEEIFGPVTTPFYSIRWLTRQDISQIKVKSSAVESPEEEDENSESKVMEGVNNEGGILEKSEVTFLNDEQIKNAFPIGTAIFVPKSHGKYVSPQYIGEMIKYGKGSDASNIHDEEVCN